MKNILQICAIFFLLNVQNTVAQSASDFKITDNEDHYFIIIFSGKKIDFSETRASITKYVWTEHASDGLKLTHILIGENRNVSAMQIETFKNGNSAMEFYNKLEKNRPDFLQMGLTKDYCFHQNSAL